MSFYVLLLVHVISGGRRPPQKIALASTLSMEYRTCWRGWFAWIASQNAGLLSLGCVELPYFWQGGRARKKKEKCARCTRIKIGDLIAVFLGDINGGSFFLWDWTWAGPPSKNPQSNAICERMHQTVTNVLRTLVHNNPPQNMTQARDIIDDALATAMHAMQTTVVLP